MKKLSQNQLAMLAMAPIRRIPPGAYLTAYSMIRRGLLARKRGKRWNDPTTLAITPAGRAALRGGSK